MTYYYFLFTLKASCAISVAILRFMRDMGEPKFDEEDIMVFICRELKLACCCNAHFISFISYRITILPYKVAVK